MPGQYLSTDPGAGTPAGGGPGARRTWDRRADGSQKGDGFLGVLKRPDGDVSSEISIGVTFDGKQVEIPALVPTLSPREVDYLLKSDVSKGQLPDSIMTKAVAYARQRGAAGKPYFASAGEQNLTLYPQFGRAPVSGDSGYLSTDPTEGQSPNQTTARPEDFTDAPPQTIGRFLGSAAAAALPSTTVPDYWEGPLYAARHPLDSIGLLGGAIYRGSADQGRKAKEAASRVLSAPTAGGKVAAASEMVGHGLGMLPIIGTPAAGAGEQLGSGDIAGGLGTSVGLLGGQVAPEAVKAVAPRVGRVLSRGNVDRMNQALGAGTKADKVRSARVAPEMVKRGIWNKDLPALEARAATESEKAGQAVGAEVGRIASHETDVLPLVEKLEQSKQEFVGTTTKGRRVVNDAAPVKAIQDLQDVLMEYGDTISIESLNKVRENWDHTVQAGRGFTTADLGTHWKTWASREGRSVLREELGKASPDINKVMAEYSFWQNIEDVAHATNQRRVGQGAGGGLIPSITGAAAGIVGEAVLPGSSVVAKVGAAAVAGKAGAAFKRLVSSSGWKMFTAVQRQRMADALMAGNTALIDDAYRAANGTARLVGQRPQAQPGRISIVGVDAGPPPPAEDDRRAAR